MFGENPFAVPISSFQRPVPLVLVDPDDEPDYNVCFRKEWLPYILACLQQLWLQTTWDTDDPAALALQQDRAKLLTSMFTRECPTCEAVIPDNAGCVSFAPNSSIISYAPQNPFTQPDYIPPGYIAVPFLEVTAGSLLSFFPGAQVGDVISGYLSLPILTPGIGEGLARFRVHTKGTGVVELHLIRFPGGGSVLITNDDDPLTVRTINLNKDIVQLPIETVGVVVVEVPILTPGEHHIDVTFVPRFNDELIFASYGGGLRAVVLCGFDQTIDQIVEQRHQDGTLSIEIEDEMRYRVNPDNCQELQIECKPGEWEKFYNPFDCGVPSAQPGSDAEQPRQGGDCVTYHAQLTADGKWLLPTVVNAGDVITISGVRGAGNDGAFASTWVCPNGQTFFAGQCFGVGGLIGGDPAATIDHMRLIVEIAGVFYDAYNTAITVPGGVASAQVTFQVNDSTLNDNSGSYTFDVETCNNQAETWIKSWNFLDEPGPFRALLSDPTYGEWIPGIGWKKTSAGANAQLSLAALIQANATSIQFTLNVTGAPAGTNHADVYIGLDLAGGAVKTQALASGLQTITYTQAPTLDYYDFNGYSDAYTGDLIVTGATMSGIGTNPF